MCYALQVLEGDLIVALIGSLIAEEEVKRPHDLLVRILTRLTEQSTTTQRRRLRHHARGPVRQRVPSSPSSFGGIPKRTQPSLSALPDCPGSSVSSYLEVYAAGAVFVNSADHLRHFFLLRLESESCHRVVELICVDGACFGVGREGEKKAAERRT